MSWFPTSQVPWVPPGESQPVIVCTVSQKGKRKVFGAWYLNEVDLGEDEDCDENEPLTGFYIDYKHDYYDSYYEPIDNVAFWQHMPEPPNET